MKDITYRLSELVSNVTLDAETWSVKAESLMMEAAEEIESLREQVYELNQDIKYLEKYQ